MFTRKKLSYAVAATMGAAVAGTANAAIEEIVVTATKTAQSAQDIGVSVQAVTGDTLKELGVETFDKYVQYLPNVTQQGRGPGRSEIYIRGVATEQSNNTVSSIQGSAPSVALYVDEQTVSFGGRNLDVYAADLERVEVLPGPQGTLFGASSQSGTVRYITNKPKQGVFEGGVSARHGWTSGGDQSTSTQAYLNVPLTEKLAVRGVFYNDNQGGWLDTVAGNFNPNTSELINVINRNQIFAASVAPDATLATAQNDDVVGENTNDAVYSGARFGLAYDINDDWHVLIQHTTQRLDTEGSFEYAPFLDDTGRESNLRFIPESNNDEWGLTTWTLNGRIGTLDVIYTGGFIDREVDNVIDYTLYTFGGGYQAYYVCNTPYAAGGATECFDPVKSYVDTTDNTRTSHEIRINTDQEKRLRFTGGLFFDNSMTESIGRFNYLGAVDAGFDAAAQNGSANSGGTVVDGTPGPGQTGFPVPGVIPVAPAGITTIFQNNFTREEDQFAAFGEVSFDISEQVTVHFGARYYDLDFALTGTTASSFGCKGDDIPDDGSVPVGSDLGGGEVVAQRADGTFGCDGNGDNNVTARLQALGIGTLEALTNFFGVGTENPVGANNSAQDIFADIQSGVLNTDGLGADGVTNQDDVIFKASVDWKPIDNILLYATYSEGFRPQTANRNAGAASSNQTGPFQNFRVPVIADSDELTNFEVGFKGDLFADTLRFNATLYFSQIDDLQTTRFDPSNVAFLVFIENVGDAEVTGIDADYIWEATENLTISGAFAWVDSEITRLDGALEGLAVPVGNELPFTADFSFNVRARYDFELPAFGANAYVTAGAIYTGDSKSGIIGNAFFVEDNVQRIFGTPSGLRIADEGGTFGASSVATEVTGSVGLTEDGQNFRNGRYIQESYVLINAAFGVEKDDWIAEFFVDNLTDERAQTNISTFDYIPTVSTNRPLTVGLRFSYDFD